jgi:hypothetical protein
LIDLRSWPKRWNEAGLRDIAILPENSGSRPWPLLAMLAIGLVTGAALGGYAVSQRNQMKRLAKHAHRVGDELAAMDSDEETEPMVPHSNHRRKATTEV